MSVQALRAGNLRMFKWFVMLSGSTFPCDLWAVIVADTKGAETFEVIEFVRKIYDLVLSQSLIACAARYGRLDIITWIIESRGTSDRNHLALPGEDEDNVLTDVVTGAVRGGHLDILQWLQNFTGFLGKGRARVSETWYVTKILRDAGFFGQIEILEWLQSCAGFLDHITPGSLEAEIPIPRPHNFLDYSPEGLCWFIDRGYVPQTDQFMCVLVRSGDLARVQWFDEVLVQHRIARTDRSACYIAVECRHWDILWFLREKGWRYFGELGAGLYGKISELELLVTYGDLELLKRVISDGCRRWTVFAVENAILADQMPILKWMLTTGPELGRADHDLPDPDPYNRPCPWCRKGIYEMLSRHKHRRGMRWFHRYMSFLESIPEVRE